MDITCAESELVYISRKNKVISKYNRRVWWPMSINNNFACKINLNLTLTLALTLSPKKESAPTTGKFLVPPSEGS